MDINRLYLGDNLEILKTLESESVDIIYLDPPYFSNRNYEVIWGIGKGDFAVTNYNDKTVMTYRHPSVEKIDFSV